MGYASRSGRARTSMSAPSAFAVCMRCGIWHNRNQLRFQNEWRGPVIQTIMILVCDRCYDKPQEQKRSINLPADPAPIYFPSVEDFAGDETNYRSVGPPGKDFITGLPIPSTALRVTGDCQNRVTTPIGDPRGLDQRAQMPWNPVAQKHFGVPLDLLSVISDGRATISVTCRAPHGLQTDSQVSAEGLANPAACGFYSVTVKNAIAFSYQITEMIKAAPLLTGTSRIVTALVGLPIGSKEIPL